jgi:DNA-directed RNA polymerase specialized sigma24 family protein
LQEVADLWGVNRSTVYAHVDRALTKLRAQLGVDSVK